jgi:hypothetical protein
MAANIEGAAIDLWDRDGTVTMDIVTTATGTPNGLLSLQGSLDGVNWKAIQSAFAELPASTAGALAAQDIFAQWSGLNYRFVRLVWTRSSGGTGATLNVRSVRVK